MAGRKEGWYWVKLGDWEPALYNGSDFEFICGDTYDADEMDAIGPRIELPEGLE